MDQVLTMLEVFGTASRLRVNWFKTKAFWISENTQVDPSNVTLANLSWEPTTFKYLGVNIYRKKTNVMEGNIRLALRNMKRDIKFWRALPLSAVGRVAFAKMISLPCLLYLFVTLPVVVGGPIIWELDCMLTDLIWGRAQEAEATHG